MLTFDFTTFYLIRMPDIRTFLTTLLLITVQLLFAEDYGLEVQPIPEKPLTEIKKDKSVKSIPNVNKGASEKGNFVFTPSLNLGHHTGFKKIYSSYGYDYSYSGFVPGVTLNIDYNIHRYASAGVYYSVAFQTYTKSDISYLGHFYGARGTFHWWQLLADKSYKGLLADKVDFDVHFHVGGFLVSEKNNVSGEKIKQTGFNAGGGIGFKYYFAKWFGVAMDGGYEEASWFKLGLVFKI